VAVHDDHCLPQVVGVHTWCVCGVWPWLPVPKRSGEGLGGGKLP